MEVKVLEVSPSCDYVKVQNLNGHKEWLETKGMEVLEVLEEVIDGKPLELQDFTENNSMPLDTFLVAANIKKEEYHRYKTTDKRL